MKWIYRGPVWGQPRITDWEKRFADHICHSYCKPYRPPSPVEQVEAYAITGDVPKALESAEFLLRGTKSSHPDCTEEAVEVILYIPSYLDGKVCLAYLFPVCSRHADEWKSTFGISVISG